MPLGDWRVGRAPSCHLGDRATRWLDGQGVDRPRRLEADSTSLQVPSPYRSPSLGSLGCCVFGVTGPGNGLLEAGLQLISRPWRSGIPSRSHICVNRDRFRGTLPVLLLANWRRVNTPPPGRRAWRHHRRTCGRRQSERALGGGPDWPDRL